MIPYIGDISKADALVLKKWAEASTSILEFGCGASTQVLSKYANHKIISLETDEVWIDKTKKNIKLLEIENEPEFHEYHSYQPTKQFDFIFNDGVDKYRRDFCFLYWKYLEVGGVLALHDTRRWQDYKNVIDFINAKYNEISKIELNDARSNISLIHKKKHQPYENWQEVEKKEQWEIGYGDPDIQKIKQRLKQIK